MHQVMCITIKKCIFCMCVCVCKYKYCRFYSIPTLGPIDYNAYIMVLTKI